MLNLQSQDIGKTLWILEIDGSSRAVGGGGGGGVWLYSPLRAYLLLRPPSSHLLPPIMKPRMKQCCSDYG